MQKEAPCIYDPSFNCQFPCKLLDLSYRIFVDQMAQFQTNPEEERLRVTQERILPENQNLQQEIEKLLKQAGYLDKCRYFYVMSLLLGTRNDSTRLF